MDVRRLNKKKIAIVGSVLIFIISVIILVSLYFTQKDFREWTDEYILKKNITDEDIYTISLNADKLNQVHVYSKYVALLNDRVVTLYNGYGEEITDIQVNINKALFDSSDKYFAIAEDNGNEVCLILDKTYLWSNKLDGQILQVHVNDNGYVAVITTDTSYKSILNLFDSSGKVLLTSYFTKTRIIDASISSDNQYVAIAELDASGALMQSNVKIISVKNAKEDVDNTIVYTYNADKGKLITNVEYQNKNQIACTYDDSICIIKDNQNIVKYTVQDKTTFMSSNFKNNYLYVEEENKGLFKNTSNLNIVNTNNEQNNVYLLEDNIKEIYTLNNVICANTGNSLYFIDINGWLIKKYMGKQEITNVMFSKSVAAIICKDKIVAINL